MTASPASPTARLVRGPAKVGAAPTDILTGLYASIAILAALQARERTGRGQRHRPGAARRAGGLPANQGMNYLYGGRCPGGGNAHPNTVPWYQDFPTASTRP